MEELREEILSQQLFRTRPRATIFSQNRLPTLTDEQLFHI